MKCLIERIEHEARMGSPAHAPADNTASEGIYSVGLPAKSGVGGGLVAVIPGKMAIAAFSPPLDEAGNSVRAQVAIAEIERQLGGNIFKIG